MMPSGVLQTSPLNTAAHSHFMSAKVQFPVSGKMIFSDQDEPAPRLGTTSAMEVCYPDYGLLIAIRPVFGSNCSFISSGIEGCSMAEVRAPEKRGDRELRCLPYAEHL